MPADVNINKDLVSVIESERKRALSDPVHLMKKYCKIEHPIKGKIYFHLYPFQEDTLRHFNDNRFNIVGKSRQMGISTLCAGHVVFKMLSQESFKVLIIATNQKVSQELILKIKVMYDNLPSWLKKHAQSTYSNLTQLTLSNGSSVEAVSSSPNAARSKALSLLIIDEAAFVPAFPLIWTSAQSTLATGGSAIILSTPNGASGLFYQLWTQANNGEAVEGLDKFNAIELKWDLHPDRDQRWRDEQVVLLGSERAAAQECDVSFESSGHTVVEPENIKWYEENTIKKPIEVRGINSEYWIWAYPDYSRNYIVAADVSRGDGSDYSTIEVFDVESCEQVAEWRGKIGTTDFGQICVTVATEWNNALLAIENSNVGWSAIQTVLDLNYSNMYYTARQDPYVDANIHLVKAQDLTNKSEMVPGHTTSPKTRPMMIAKLQTATAQASRYMIYHSSRLQNEFRTFKWINGKAQAAEGYNDDLIMATSIILYVLDTAIKMRNQGIALNKMAISRFQKVMYKPTKVNPQYTMKVLGKPTDLTWLL